MIFKPSLNRSSIVLPIAKYSSIALIVKGWFFLNCSGSKASITWADAIIDLKQLEELIVDSFKKEAGDGYDVILDFLWGHPTEVLIQTLIPDEIGYVGNRTRLVQVGEAAGETISLPANSLRNTGLEIIGASAGMTPEAMNESTNQVWEWIKENKLRMDIEKVPLKDIESTWNRTDFQGKRIVIVP